MTVEIKPLSRVDLPSILQLAEPASVGFYWSEENLKIEFAQAKGLGLWVFDELAAFVLWRNLPEAQEITVLATAEKFKRQGMMGQLLKQAIAAYSREEQWWLEVHEKNTSARNLYEKLGFIQSGQRPHYYRDGGDAVLYTYQRKTT